MSIAVTIRRYGLAVVGLVGAAALTVACSSSTSGTGTGPTAPATSPKVSASIPAGASSSIQVSLPASLSASIPSGSIPTLGGSKFCTDLSKLGNIGSSISSDPSGINSLLKGLDALVAEAPAQIKPDVQLLDTYVHDAANGKFDSNLTNKLATAETDIATFIEKNCHP